MPAHAAVLRWTRIRASYLPAAAAVALAVLVACVHGHSATLVGDAPVQAVPSVVAAPSTHSLTSSSTLAPLPGVAASSPTRAQRSAAVRAYGRLPLAFEPNHGQFDRRAMFSARGAGYRLYLTHKAMLLSLARGSGHLASAASLRLRFVGASAAAELSAARPLPGTVSYFQGKASARWHRGIATYARAHYQDLWPGIGMVVYGNQGQLEYDFRLAPGADPRQIGLAFGGARSLHLDPAGRLVLHLAGGTLRQLRPHAYQLVDGVRRGVPTRYVVHGRQVGIRLGRYDHRLPLVIDPALSYSTYLGGTGGEQPDGIAVDSAGNAYITGLTNSSDFPTTTGAYQTSPTDCCDAFVTKLDPTGAALSYSTYLGGTAASNDIGYGIAVDNAGNAYITGLTNSSDFPTTNGAYQTSYGGGGDAFVAKLDPTGTALSYSTYLGGSAQDDGFGIGVDSSGNAYLTGFTDSTDLPTTAGANQTSYGGGDDGFVTKLNAGGTALSYSTYLGGSAYDLGWGIAVDSAGNAYVSGTTWSSDFPTTTGAYQTSPGDCCDAFVTKLDATGAALTYSTYLGGNGGDYGRGIAIDASGNAYLTGSTDSTDFPTTAGAYQTSPGGAFVSKLDPTGTGLSYSTYLGAGGGGTAGYGIALDGSANAYVSGNTSGDFPTTASAPQPDPGGGGDAFVAKLNSAGTGLFYSTYLGGSDYEEVAQTGAIAVDSAGNAYVTGPTYSSDFPITTGAYQTSYDGNGDAFVAKIEAVQADDSASEVAPAGGTVSTNTTTSPDDPVGSSVTTPNAGQVTIDEGSTTTPDPTGYSLIGQQVQITAPTATAASPLVIQFLLDASVLPAGADPSTLQVFRDGVPIADCATGASSSASPDPCVATRAANGSGGVALTVRTSHASSWNFGLHSAYAFQGFFSPIAAPPTLNSAKATSTVSLRFSLGGNQGLRISGSGYPRSHRISCNAAATDMGDDAPTNGSLSYDKKSTRYTYAWKSAKAWAGSCRQFVLHLIDGSYHRANFRFSK